MRFRDFVLLAAMAAVFGGATAASAYTGGPDVVEILGWDPGTERVYFHAIPGGETSDIGGTFYFDFRSPNPWKRQQAPWSLAGVSFDDTLQKAKLKSLKARLQRMSPEVAPVFPSGRWRVVSSDTLRLPYDRVKRLFVRMTPYGGPEFEVVAYGRPEVVVKDVYPIPGREIRIFVLTFFGNPYDGLAETQVPVVGLPGVPRIEWSRGR